MGHGAWQYSSLRSVLIVGRGEPSMYVCMIPGLKLHFLYASLVAASPSCLSEQAVVLRTAIYVSPTLTLSVATWAHQMYYRHWTSVHQSVMQQMGVTISPYMRPFEACWLKNMAFTGHAGKNSGATGSAVNLVSCLKIVVYGM